jgi:A/G-specific adenine glycosylase
MLSTRLLEWYDRHRRRLPWRAEPGVTADPYLVWLSEIMLQQTVVVAVIPYFARFTALFPNVAALAAAPDDQVMAAWAGLGYYARARNLLACAREVAKIGGFPSTPEALRALPGIGPYTANAIAAIAFGAPVIPVDGNVERVVSRLFAIQTPLPRSRPEIAERATALVDANRASDLAQALFDLGATICTPRSPACTICPLRTDCAAHAQAIQTSLPRKDPKKPRPTRYGVHFYLTDGDGNLLLRRRPPSGLLGGMTELPGPAWRDQPWGLEETLAEAPQHADWRKAGSIEHAITHFHLVIDVYVAQLPRIQAEGFLRAEGELEQEALPGVMRKCIQKAQEAAPLF